MMPMAFVESGRSSGSTEWAALPARRARAFSSENQARHRVETDSRACRVSLSGAWSHRNLDPLRDLFRQLADQQQPVEIDLAGTLHVDAAFMGLLLMLQKRLGPHAPLTVTGLSPGLGRVFRWHRMDHLAVAQGSQPPAP